MSEDEQIKSASFSPELYLTNEVPVLDDIPSPLELYREWIAPNKPVIFRGAVKKWPAIGKWSYDYLRKQIGNKEVSVAVTPNGYADAPCDGYFVMPEERSMMFANFLDIMEDPKNQPGVFYVQKQNSNFTEEFSEILCDASPDIPWFSEALGKDPDAVNFWMGDQRAVTSMHKDHYENIYCVVSGYKDFILLPPTDSAWVPYKSYPAATYKETTAGSFIIQEDTNTGSVPWICIDPVKPDLEKYPQYKHASPVFCRVHAGDALYLPSLWFHHVRQSHACIAVNYWYDMEYDIKYNYYKFIQNLSWLKEPE
ncbi:Bifunctional peptidase and (3S)-lysyl hydroxylase Jmjd7-like [Homarus americanus]|uniref:Bifunctional peptidase and (3S)-lysyl hydroxylase JMJD7 n=1 Tax=Homarus americanus TaxID=6706 RepID=A0A8J5NHY2_HOMAM|nr:Bifunctional peptidase and (3S)-lysyl hydroxylase Jmjd7-like [Homarus americanus]